MQFNYHSYTIEKEYEKFAVFGHGEYPEDSVLAGQYARGFIDSFDTLEEAQAVYPEAEFSELKTGIPSGWRVMSDLPPTDFDPYYAGERWDDDY
jgi:hypothetical protein